MPVAHVNGGHLHYQIEGPGNAPALVLSNSLGIHAGKRLHQLVLCSTGAKIGNAEIWDARIEVVRKGGTKSIAAGAMERWFTARFRESSPEIVERVKQMVGSTSTEGFVACCEALREADFREGVKAIRTPTLVISGTHDSGTTPADGKFMAKQIAGARYGELDVAHLSNIEQHERFTQEVSDFLRHSSVTAAS